MLAVVFPGQGSQAVGMASDFAERYPESRSVLKEADEAFGGPLSEWIARGPEETLRRTEVTQPAILSASIAIYRAIESKLPVYSPRLCRDGRARRSRELQLSGPDGDCGGEGGGRGGRVRAG
jgi:malonyl CoA-acyl carrier protein transacylase